MNNITIEKNKLYLVTGGSGFLGDSLIDRILQQGGLVRVLARNEGSLIKLKMKYPSIEILTGDISNRFSCIQALKNVNGIFHLAAFKHVGMAEIQSLECINSNVIGSSILLEESANMELDFILGISTDKAAQVAGVYGASKLLMEKLFEQYEKIFPNTNYRLVRYGNILYSTGSVLCKWKKLIEENKPITITDGNATRFYWSVEQAVDLIFECLKNSKDYRLYCPTMKSVSVRNLAKAMIKKYGNSNIKIITIGLQPGENMHEKILKEGPYSNEVAQYTIDEIVEMV